MKIRLVVMTENDKHSNLPKEKLENVTKAAWELVFELLSTNGDKATIESVEVVEE